MLDPGEGCDDGPANQPYKACTDECQPNVCGDGKVHTGVEGCDEGDANVDTGACRSDCQPNVCGDGYWLVSVEECDAGAANGPLYNQCDEHCTINRCGDGELDPGHELCDDGEANGSGRSDGETAACALDCGFSGRRLFLSSKKFSGAMQSRAGADLACQNMAKAAGFTHADRFVALLADAEGSPNTYVASDPENRPFILPSGLILAGSYPELISQGPGLGVTATETGEILTKQPVWTNIGPFGDAFLKTPESTCTGWTSSAPDQTSRVGLNAVEPDDDKFAEWQSERQWLSFGAKYCSWEFRIYCIEAKIE